MILFRKIRTRRKSGSIGFVQDTVAVVVPGMTLRLDTALGGKVSTQARKVIGDPPVQPLGEEEITDLACCPPKHPPNSVYVNEVQVGVEITPGGLHVVVPAMQPFVQVEGQVTVVVGVVQRPMPSLFVSTQEIPLRQAFETEVGQRLEVGTRQTPTPLLSLSMQLSWTVFPLNVCVPQEKVLLQIELREEQVLPF